MLLLAQRSFHAFFLSVACEKMNKHHISSLRCKKRKRNPVSVLHHGAAAEKGKNMHGRNFGLFPVRGLPDAKVAADNLFPAPAKKLRGQPAQPGKLCADANFKRCEFYGG